MNVKKLGNKTEEDLCRFLMYNGYWCRLLGYNANGQPCDIVAIRGKKAILIDCKHCATDIFNFGNIQPNQLEAFNFARKMCKVENTGFAIFWEKKKIFVWLPYEMINLSEKSIELKNLPRLEVFLWMK